MCSLADLESSFKKWLYEKKLNKNCLMEMKTKYANFDNFHLTFMKNDLETRSVKLN